MPVARRIADHVALAVSHEQLAEIAARRRRKPSCARSASKRASRSLSDELEVEERARIASSARRPNGRRVLKAATQVAPTDTTVLLVGRVGHGQGSGRAVHPPRVEARAGGPFVALNCAALPEQLLESELFGYERGAFTGAQQAKPGQIELAAGGVLFLDEVGEMSPSAQAKFLRVLQEREFQRLGGTRTLKADVRVDRRDQPRPAEGDGARRLPRGSLLSAAGVRHRGFRRCASAPSTSCR